MSGPVPPPAAVEAALRSRIGSISGAFVAHVTTMPFSVKSVPTPAPHRIVVHDYNVTVHGWSSSLHLHCMNWQAKVRVNQPDVLIARDVLAAFSRHIEAQERRCEQGIAMGIATPLNTDLAKAAVPVGHMMIDGALARLMVTNRPRPLIDQIADSVASLHRTDLGSGVEDGIYSDDRITGRTFSCLEQVGEGVYFDGYSLNIRDQLPETVKDAASGRRLGDLVDVPDFLGDHAITDFEEDGDLQFIHLLPRHVRVGEICGLD